VPDRPLILISAATHEWGPYWATTFTRPLVAAGAVPVMLPLIEGEDARRAALRHADGLLLGGGADIEPHHYGESPGPLLGPPDRLRDAVELPIAREAMEEGVPVVGTCRGMQILSVALGGTLYVDASQHPGAEDHPSGGVAGFKPVYLAEMDGSPQPPLTTHPVTTAPGSALRMALGPERDLNSYHHQHLRDLPAGMAATAVAEDGVIEGVEIEGAPALVLGVQWELQVGWRTDPCQFALFELLVEHARSRRAGRRAAA
jgi:gamma-glutamyl-gamma-aminobutyrate hydrolase PuuD